VLGGGIVPGSVVLVGGEPGIGKSTLLLQCAARLEHAGIRTLYVSGEESPDQVRLRADRLTLDAGAVHVLGETRLEAITHHAHALNAQVVFVDSIQTTYTDDLEGAPGNVGQVRECAARLMRLAKEAGPAVLLVGHVTKGGGIAGPKTLEHIVDTVLYFEGESTLDRRILRAVKNRFGSVDEIGVFRMTGAGLEPVANPAAAFLAGRSTGASGSAVTALMEGTRPMLVEIQALASKAGFGTPQRVATGLDHRRLALLLAVLERRGGLPFGNLDVFVNVTGGVRLIEPSTDLAVLAALVSTVHDRPVPAGAHRADSVRAGLVALPDDATIILIHDAARPFVSRETIDAVIARARAGVGAVAAVPTADTLKEVGLGPDRPTPRITRTVDRERIWRAQTPQGFPRKMLHDAYAQLGATSNGGAPSDDAEVCERAGFPVE